LDIIRTFGYHPAITNLLTVPSESPLCHCGASPLHHMMHDGIIRLRRHCVLAFAVVSDHTRRRFPFIVASQLTAMLGFFINISGAHSGAKHFGLFLRAAGSYGAFPGVICWLGNNLSPRTKRAVGMAMQVGLGNFGGAAASNLYRSQDAPR